MIYRYQLPISAPGILLLKNKTDLLQCLFEEKLKKKIGIITNSWYLVIMPSYWFQFYRYHISDTIIENYKQIYSSVCRFSSLY